MDKNLKARASSRNPRKTFTVFNQPPDLGREFNQPGKAANNPKGRARAKENPNIPTNGPIPPIVAASTRRVPTIGPVQEKETSAKVKAMKKIPINPPLSEAESALLIHEFGSVISKAPINEIAKTTNKIKNKTLNQTLVDSAFKASEPKIAVTRVPRTTYINIIEIP